jgi:hypothetical protein
MASNFEKTLDALSGAVVNAIHAQDEKAALKALVLFEEAIVRTSQERVMGGSLGTGKEVLTREQKLTMLHASAESAAKLASTAFKSSGDVKAKVKELRKMC